ncbi:MAG: AAA family ATPase [Symbiobacteriaceae bacterium]|nr:AAA family ATPase [Symbiobacteriaceae bacterium]
MNQPRNTNRERLEVLLKARYPLLYLPSWEESRIIELLAEISRESVIQKTVYTWNIASGIKRLGFDMVPGTLEPMAALDFVERYPQPAVFCFFDLHPFLENHPVTVRRLKNLTMKMRTEFKTILIVSPLLKIPLELQKLITVFDFELPDYHEIEAVLNLVIARQDEKGYRVDLNESEKERLIKACQGLTLEEVENSFAKAVVTDGILSASDIELVLEEKRQIIRKTGILEYFPVDVGMDSVGGLEVLKEWLRKRSRSFTEEAKEFGLPAPKGVLVTGMPGCGKSLCAKAASSLWQLPLLRLDMGRIYAGLVGSSEENMRKAIATAEAIAPCILWVDEIEKGFAGTGSSGDSGVSSRVFGTFLTWMQEKQEAVFVFATANAIERLPPELLRKGRFDEIFFVELPSLSEREEIIRIHLRKRRKDPAEFNLPALGEMTDGYSGSELEQVVISAMLDAFDDNRSLEQRDLETCIQQTVPLARTMREQVEILRQWAKDRALLA